MDDVEAKVFGRLPDDTWFYPGHGNDSTLGAERAARWPSGAPAAGDPHHLRADDVSPRRRRGRLDA